MLVLRYFVLLSFIMPAFSCSSQDAKAKTIEKEFSKFDGNNSGWLSGKELVSCNCLAYDTNGDNEVTKEEFFAGKGSKIPLSNNVVANASQEKTNITEQKVEETNNGTASKNISGKWLYTTIVYADGTLYPLRNRQSGLDLHEDGTYNQNIWVGTNLQGRVGKYNFSGSRLTLTPGGGEKETFTVSFSADKKLLNLTGTDGSGWKLERGK